MTLKDISDMYFKAYKVRVRKNSYQKSKYLYFRVFKNYSEILEKQITDIDENDLINFQNYLKENFSNNTACRMYYILINIFELAKKIKLINFNIAKAVKSLKLNRTYKIKNIVTEEKFYNMLKYIEKINERIYLELIFTTGLRSSEVRALKWEDIDFKNSTLSVNKSVQCQKIGEYEICDVKTKSSNRIIMIDRITLSLLQKLKDESISGKDFIFNKNGFPMTINFCRYSIKRACEKANIQVISIHNLRHSHATNMLTKNVPIAVISRRLGHAHTGITENIYIHLIVTDDIKVIEQQQYRAKNSLNV